MSKIRIKNFGPIKEGFTETLPDGTVSEWMDVKKVTVFIGNQGSGKSTVAKLISTLSWIEKALELEVITNQKNLRAIADFKKIIAAISESKIIFLTMKNLIWQKLNIAVILIESRFTIKEYFVCYRGEK